MKIFCKFDAQHNQKSLGIVYDDKCIGTNRGFHNVDVDLFLPIDVPSPWD